jgi:hypothetical protein
MRRWSTVQGVYLAEVGNHWPVHKRSVSITRSMASSRYSSVITAMKTSPAWLGRSFHPDD